MSVCFVTPIDILGFPLSCGSLLLFMHGQLYVPTCMLKFFLIGLSSLLLLDNFIVDLCRGCWLFLPLVYDFLFVCWFTLASLLAPGLLLLALVLSFACLFKDNQDFCLVMLPCYSMCNNKCYALRCTLHCSHIKSNFMPYLRSLVTTLYCGYGLVLVPLFDFPFLC